MGGFDGLGVVTFATTNRFSGFGAAVFAAMGGLLVSVLCFLYYTVCFVMLLFVLIVCYIIDLFYVP